MRILLGIVSVVAVLGGCVTSTSTSAPPRVYETFLDNGLKVIVKPDHRAPIVISQIWYKVGSSYEPKGMSGISHVLEHMMFKGTKTLKPNEFSRIIAEQGGRENAFTSKDYTAYFQTLEKSRLSIAFRLEADRMRNLDIKKGEFEKEIEVVKEERRLQVEDRPESVTYEKFIAAAFVNSNYKNPVIGWPQDLEKLRVEDVRDWYHRFYVPNNATLVVAGDVTPEEVFDLARVHFGDVSSRQVPPMNNPQTPAQGGTRLVTESKVAKVPYLLMGYHAPVLATATPDKEWEPYALEISAYLLDSGKSARLPQELVRRQQIASTVSAGYDPLSRGSGLFIIDANPGPGHSLEELEIGIKSEIKRLQEELITSTELSRIKAQIVAAKVFEEDSVFYQAMKIGILETNGLSWELGENFHNRLRDVTAEQVREVVKTYLIDRNLTVTVMKVDSG